MGGIRFTRGFLRKSALPVATPGFVVKLHAARPLILLSLLAGVSGCESFPGFLDKRAAAERDTELPASRTQLEPISRNYFELDAPEQSVVGALQIVFTSETDTFSDLAREYGLGYDELVAANPGVDPWIPSPGTPILLPTQYILPAAPRQGIVLNIASKRLFYFPPLEEGKPQQVLTYPIGIGRVGWETPLGSSTVIAKARDPHWYVPTSVRQEHAELGDPLPAVVPPGPDNPLGRHVLKLGMPGYLIHGTNQPYGVGMRVSHGCVRLYPENIDTLYSMIELGTPVTIVNQPHLLGRHGTQMYFESHLPLEDHQVDTEQHLQALLESATAGELLQTAPDNVAAQMQTVVHDALGVPVLLHKRDTAEIYERARVVRNTVEPNPDAPTLSEVRELLEQPLEPAEDAEGSVN